MGILDLRKERENYWSVSRINSYLLCPLAYMFSYVVKTPREFIPVCMTLGSAVHRCQEQTTQMRTEGNKLSGDDVEELFSDIWDRQIKEESQPIRYNNGDDAESTKVMGIGLARCLHDTADESEEIVSISEAAAVPLTDSAGVTLDAPLIFEIDLVIRTEDGAKVIVDWKTGRRWAKGKADRELQPTAYVWGYKLLHGEHLPFRYDIAVKNKTPVLQQEITTRDEDSYLRLVELVKVVDAVTKSGPGMFCPNHNSFCGTCGFQGACKTWHKDRAKMISVAA